MEPVYLPRPIDAERDLGRPGEFPYTRGIHPGMYRERLWTMRQYAGFGDAARSNERYRYLIARGQTGLSVAFDLPTQMGYDSDHPMAAGEVGRAGVAIGSVADMERLLDGIDLAAVSTSMTINATAPILLAFYVAVARRRGVPLDRLSGTVQNDILKEYIARGTYIYPPKPSMRLTTDLFSWAARHAPRWNVISVSGYHMREAGATAVQEVGFTLADACAYLDAALAAGLAVDDFAPQVSFFFSADRNFLEEIAKFRAARRLYARLMRERYGAKNPRSLKMRFHAQTAGSSLTAQQPEVNVVRTAIEALSAVLGGCQSLHTNSLDEALALPTEAAATLALRTQQVLAYETGVAETADPLAGSYCIETLTDEIEAGARAYIERIDSMGGMAAAIEQGFPQREIQAAAYELQRRVESGERTIVGVNRFTEETPGASERRLFRLDPTAERERVAALAAWKAGRDAGPVRDSLTALGRAARGDANLFPFILAAAEAEATLGEISDELRSVFGVFPERVVI